MKKRHFSSDKKIVGKSRTLDIVCHTGRFNIGNLIENRRHAIYGHVIRRLRPMYPSNSARISHACDSLRNPGGLPRQGGCGRSPIWLFRESLWVRKYCDIGILLQGAGVGFLRVT